MDATRYQAIFWKVFSMACFAGINGIVRFLSGGAGAEGGEGLPVNVIMFFQNVAGTLVLLPALSLNPRSLMPAFAGMTKSTKLMSWHLARIMAAVLGVYLWYATLRVMPIAEGVALSFTGPVFTVIGAWLFLSEKMSGQRVLAIGLCFVGAFVVTRPDIALLSGDAALGAVVAIPLASAVFLALSQIATRKLALLGEDPGRLASYLLLFMTPASLVFALWEWKMPVGNEWAWLALLGALAALAHFSYARAFQLAEVTFLTPFGFSKFILSALVGYLAFNEISMQLGLWLGTLFIALSIIVLTFFDSLRRTPSPVTARQ